MRFGLKKLAAIFYAVVAIAGVTTSNEAKASTPSAILKYEGSPLYLEHSKSMEEISSDSGKSYQSDCERRRGHSSHRSHYSHRSHRSHYSGR
jgi:hypothetical protein